MAEIIKLPKKRPSKTIKQHRKWEEFDRCQLREAYEKVRGDVPKDWFKEQAKKYDRTILAIMKQVNPSNFENYVKPPTITNQSEIVVKYIVPDNPLKMAQHTFSGRWKEENGNYWIRLYGQWNPVGLHAFIRAANVIRKSRDEILITGCDLWKP
jgi:hypothetical protein